MDDTLNFCLSDGVALFFSPESSEETVVLNSPNITQPSQPIRQGVNPLFAYLAVALLALMVGGAIVAFVTSRSSPETNNKTQQKNETPVNTMSNVAPNTNASYGFVNNRNVGVVQSPDSKQQLLTTEAVQNLVSTWERAQNGKNFASYQACYDPSFVGVKKTKSGHSQTYGYGAWMADRRKMIAQAINLNVSHANMQIRTDGDTAIVQFDQYYRSLKYSDWGPKEIRVKMTPSGSKIVREELMSSNPL